jgi:hypothetical protein
MDLKNSFSYLTMFYGKTIDLKDNLNFYYDLVFKKEFYLDGLVKIMSL